MSDERIKKDVVDRLYWDNRVDASDVKVEVNDSKVTLTGTVPSYTARRAAITEALQVWGVQSIDAKLDVHYPTSVGLPTDEEIKDRIVNVIEWGSDVDAADVSVQVLEGLATLQGSVESCWQKQRAEELAAGVTGVRDIKNNLVVVPKKTSLDKAIADWILSALDRETYVDVDSVHVTVDKGSVHLEGTVPNRAGYVAAEESVKRTAGVTDVRNDLAIG
jgi:osmotically-inducible protein OsmY